MSGLVAGKVALVAGGAGAIGRACGAALAEAGARVMLADLDEAAAKAAVTQGQGNAGLRLDVTSETDWAEAIAATEEAFGPLGILVISSGYYRPNLALDTYDLEEWRRHMSINADGTFLGVRAAIAAMRASGTAGAIVTMGSSLVAQPHPGGAGYVASKAAVEGLTRTAARFAGPYNIRVNAVSPGPTHSAMLYGNVQEGGSVDALVDRLAARNPIPRIGEPRDIAETVLFLCSDKASFLTGAIVPVDGGQTA